MNSKKKEYTRQVAMFRRSLELQASAAGVFVQKVPAAYLKRIMSDTNSSDPLVKNLQDLDRVFADCKKKDVDMASSVDGLLEEYDQNRRNKACVLLAWHMKFDNEDKKLKDPELVGMATVAMFESTPNYSTDEYDPATKKGSVSKEDMKKLEPYFGKYMYIDCLCSKRAGVGRLLVLHTYKHALVSKAQGLIALSFSVNTKNPPESKKLFRDLKFDTLIEKADFKIKMYGTWFELSSKNLPFAGIAKASLDVCTRKGFTPKTADNLIWRCGN